VTTETRNVFVDVTGWDLNKVMLALNVVVTALAERGGKIRSVKVVYPDFELESPDLTPKEFEVEPDYIRKLAGLELGDDEIKDLLERMMYEVKLGGKIYVLYPAFRDDIMHARDVLEDVLIAYGYNEIEPEEPKLAVQGRGDKFIEFEDAVRELMIGFGLQEVMTFNLTNRGAQYEKMNLQYGRDYFNNPPAELVEIENPISPKWSALRNWLLPSLLDFLSQNTHVEYPQRLFEVGKATLIDESRETKTVGESKLAVVLAQPRVTFTDAKEILEGVMRHLGFAYELEETEHPSFIPGRVGRIIVKEKTIGVIGEIHPAVLEKWGIEMPVVGFELFLRPLYTEPYL